MARLSFEQSEGREIPAAKPVYRMRRTTSSDLFTESAFVFTMKTMWARVTTPRALEYYHAVVRQFVGLSLLILATMAAIVVWVIRQFGELGLFTLKAGKHSLDRVGRGADAVGQRLDKAGRGVGRRVTRCTGSIGQGVGNVGRGVSSASRGVVSGVNRGVGSAERGFSSVGRGVGVVGRSVSGAGRSMGYGISGCSSRAASIALSVLSAVSREVAVLAHLVAAGFGILWSLSCRTGLRAWRLSVRLAALSRRGARRHRFATATLAMSLVLLLTAPAISRVLTVLTDGVRSRIASLPEPSLAKIPVPSVTLPEVLIPRVTFHKPRLPKLSSTELRIPDLAVPDVSIQLPAFITMSIRRLDEMLAGPLVEPNARLLVADLKGDSESRADLDRVLALVLEAELAPARHFTVLPRERALAAVKGPRSGDGFALSAEQAVALAAVTGSAAVVTGRYAIADEVYSLDLVVLDPAGEEVYRVTSFGAEAGLLDAVVEGAHGLKQRLGESAEDNPALVGPALSSSLPALHAYADARSLLRRGRYRASIAAAAAAARQDTAFAAAYRVAGDAYALAGQRRRAREALENAWRVRGRLSERERLRLAADRKALAGRYSDAIAAYDRLFSLYRDDVSALKSQAVLQRMIGARGRGVGNLRVAYSIDPVDWPSLQRIARFLGYRGRLPSMDTFAAAEDRASAVRPSI
ncbi:MAG: tetratricopeptide repeat protein [Gemmatimonadota bacterium]